MAVEPTPEPCPPAKPWYQSKALILNILAFVVLIVDLLMQQPFIPPAWLPYLTAAIAVLNLVIRYWFTDSAIKR